MPDAPSTAAPTARPAWSGRHPRQRGQVLVIFAGAIVLFVGILAIVVDISWYWSNSLRVQRAADAAALAGVVWLPGDVTHGVAAADAAAAQNGYPASQVGVAISAHQDSQITTGGNPNQMDVTISAPVSTFFMRLFGITKITATRTSHAVYVLPVPMGSPLNYYGDFGLVRHPGGGTTNPGPTQTLGPNSPTAPTATQFGGWTNPQNAFTTEKPTPKYATITETTHSNTDQSWTKFDLTGFPSGAVIDGIQVNVIINATRTGCAVSADMSWNGGFSWTNATESIAGIPTKDTGAQFGGPADDWMTGNQSHTWAPSDFSNSNFVVRLSDDGGNNCDTTSGSRNHTISLDLIQVVVTYHTTTFVADANLTGPNSESLAPQGFWGTMMSEGGISLNGDAYMPRYDTRTSPTNSLYNSATYYNYDIQTQPGAPNAQLWIYDPEFCASDGSGQYGTGDRYLDSTSPAPMDAFYDVYDTKLTQDTSDDTLLYSSKTAGLFQPTKVLADPGLFDQGDLPGGTTDCSKDPTHLNWWQVPVTLLGGHLYRLHTYTTDPANANAQNNADGHNSFTIWAGWAGAGNSSLLPRVYGVGAMETFEPLPGGGASIFYLAQIGAQHAGKTMEIDLWDPGDTGVLPAALRILQPTTTGYTPVTFSWTAKKGNTNGQSCTSTGTKVTSVTTNVGDASKGQNATTGVFNGCWLTIIIPLPSAYNAPTPPGETHGGGWWKIEYDMGGKSSFAPAFDLTTWQVNLLGNPVHLVIP